MKTFNRSLLSALWISMVFILAPSVSDGQNQLTEAQRKIIIYRTDSVINLYQRYSTFVEDAGNFSKTYASKFEKLFSEKAILFNDVDPVLQLPVVLTNPPYGLYPAGYTAFVLINFPKGIGIADFSIEKRSDPVPLNNGKDYLITVTGQKAIETFTANNKLFKRDFTDYEIQLICKSNLTNFKINGISLTKLNLKPPLSPVVINDVTVTIVNQEGKQLEDAIITLLVDGKEVAQKESKSDGKVIFKQIAKGNNVTISGYSPSDSLSGSITMRYDEFIKPNTTLTLKRQPTISMSVVVQNSKSSASVPDATVNYLLNGKIRGNSTTDEKGNITISGLQVGSKVELSIEKYGFSPLKKEVNISNTSTFQEIIQIIPLPDEQEIRFSVGGGLNRPSTNNTIGQSWTMKPGIAIGISYGYFPQKFKKESFDLGAYGTLSYINSKFNGSSDSVSGQYDYIDIESYACKLNVTANNISDSYITSSVDLGFGIIFHKQLAGPIQVSVNVGPVLSILTGSSFEADRGTKLTYSGVYSQYYGVELEGISRLGYSTINLQNTTNNSPVPLKKINFGLSLEASLGYKINEQIGATAGLFFRSILNNMISNDTSRQLSYLKNGSGNTTPVSEYKGLLNTHEKYSQTLFGMQLGITYKIQ